MKNLLSTFFLFLFIFLDNSVLAGKDYYKILGISRDADANTIKRAFKKLSLKYHPDKNKKDPETAKKKFVEIANAYEVLSDPEKKKIYDIHGEEGVQEQAARENAGQQGHHGGPFGNFHFNFNGGGGGASFEDMFSQFFSGGGHRRQQHHHHAGGHHGHGQHFHQQEQQQEEEEKNYFEQTDVIQIKMNNLSKIYRRQEIWFVLFFKSTDAKFKEMVDLFKELGEKSYGVFKIGAVNCNTDEEICEEFDVRTTPVIVYYPESSDNQEVYRGKKTWNDIFTFGSNRMQSFVRVINSENYGDFVTSNPTQHKVLLFTARKTAPPLLKALSKYFLGKLSFGIIRETEKELMTSFKINKVPSVLVVSDAENHRGDLYDGPLSRDQLQNYLSKFAYTAVKAENKAEVVEFTPEVYSKMCNESDGKHICVVYLFDGYDLSSNVRSLLEKLAQKYVNDPLKFLYLNVSKFNHIYLSFAKEDQAANQLMVIKGKRKTYSVYESDLDLVGVSNFLDNIISGGGSFKKLVRKLHFAETGGKDDL